MKIQWQVSAAVSLAVLSACAHADITIPYTPKTTSELDGAVSVEKFTYSPEGKLDPKEIRETAAGTIHLTENVDSFFTNSVKRELQQAGLSLKGRDYIIGGDIKELILDDLGFSATWRSIVDYTVTRQGTLVYSERHKVEFETSKFMTTPIENISKMISDNIGKFIYDVETKNTLYACK